MNIYLSVRYADIKLWNSFTSSHVVENVSLEYSVNKSTFYLRKIQNPNVSYLKPNLILKHFLKHLQISMPK